MMALSADDLLTMIWYCLNNQFIWVTENIVSITRRCKMYTFFGRIIVPDAEAFIKMSKSMPAEHLDEWGVVEQTFFRIVNENRIMIVNTYKTLEEAQKHKADIESPAVEAQMKQMGVQLPMDLWIAEQA
jgi:hypothetical protein